MPPQHFPPDNPAPSEPGSDNDSTVTMVLPRHPPVNPTLLQRGPFRDTLLHHLLGWLDKWRRYTPLTRMSIIADTVTGALSIYGWACRILASFTDVRSFPQIDITRRAAEATLTTYLSRDKDLLQPALHCTGPALALLQQHLSDNLGLVLSRLETIGRAFYGTPAHTIAYLSKLAALPRTLSVGAVLTTLPSSHPCTGAPTPRVQEFNCKPSHLDAMLMHELPPSHTLPPALAVEAFVYSSGELGLAVVGDSPTHWPDGVTRQSWCLVTRGARLSVMWTR